MYRVLQIDDDDLMRSIVASVLSPEAGFELTASDGGAAGIAAARALQPHLILCDVTMPGMSGQDVIRTLRKDSSTANIPLIFTTGRTPPDAVRELMSLGAAAVIAKPFKLADLAQQVASHLRIDDAPDVDDKPAEYDMQHRMRDDAATLSRLRTRFVNGANADILEDIRSCAHKLAGAAGIYGYAEVSRRAAAIEQKVIAEQKGTGGAQDILQAVDALLRHIGSELGDKPHSPECEHQER